MSRDSSVSIVIRLRAWITRESGFGSSLGNQAPVLGWDKALSIRQSVHTGSDHSPPFSARR